MSAYFTGARTPRDAQVHVVENERARPLPHHVRHSPTGFEWGYHGSGPAELARCLLLESLNLVSDVARKHELEEAVEDRYHEFKVAFVGRIAGSHWRIDVDAVLAWLEDVSRRMRGEMAGTVAMGPLREAVAAANTGARG